MITSVRVISKTGHDRPGGEAGRGGEGREERRDGEAGRRALMRHAHEESVCALKLEPAQIARAGQCRDEESRVGRRGRREGAEGRGGVEERWRRGERGGQGESR